MLQREIFAYIWENIDSRDVLLLNGPRQVGKTTLLESLIERLKQERNILDKQIHFFDLERVEDLSIWSNQVKALGSLPLSDSQKHYLFIDEFQHSTTIGSTVKVIHDHHPNFKVILTGSASWYLNINESLMGRKRVISIWPLNFREFLWWKNDERFTKIYENLATHLALLTSAHVEYLNQSFLEFLTFGGYPRVVLAPSHEEKLKILAELLNSYLLRDLGLTQFRENSPHLQTLLILIASRTGSLVETSSLARDLGLGRTALLNRLTLLRNTFILHEIRPFFTNKTKELVKSPKMYLVDAGLRNLLLKEFGFSPRTPQFGSVCENVVALEIAKQSRVLDQILFWRTKNGQEVDLILKRNGDVIPIEIKSGVVTSVPSAMKSFIETYHPKQAYILNWNNVDEVVLGNTKILFRPLWFPI